MIDWTCRKRGPRFPASCNVAPRKIIVAIAALSAVGVVGQDEQLVLATFQ